MARTTPTFVTTCAWCKHTIALLHDQPISAGAVEQRILVHIRGSTTYEVWGVESHGVCGYCKREQAAWLAALPTSKADETPCCHGVPGTEWCTACEAEV